MIESGYTASVHRKLDQEIYHWKVNDNYAGGVPDAFYRLKNVDSRHLWIEYKFIKNLPIRESTVVVPTLSALQREWLEQAHNAGEQAIVVVGVERVRGHRFAQGFVLEYGEWDGIPCKEVAMRLHDYAGIARIIHDYVCNRN